MAIAFDVATTSEIGDGGSAVTFSHTCTGANRYLEVSFHFGVSVAATRTTVSATYSGVGMSLVKDSGASGDNWAKVITYGLLAPATGANNVVATLDGDSLGRVGVIAKSYTGVHQSTPTGTAVSATGTNGNPTVNAASASGELVIDAVALSHVAETLTVGGGQLQRANTETVGSSGGCDFAASEEAGATTVTMSWTATGGGENWAIVAVPLKPASAGGGFVPDEDFLTFIPARI